ncbi:leucyl aminopeptidase [bacterium]|nr:leucyl aminopeptidase [bacterium]
MQVKFSAEASGDAHAYFVFEGAKGIVFPEGAPDELNAAVKRAGAVSRFKGGAGQVLEFLSPEWSKADRVLVCGVGKKDKAGPIDWQKAAGGVVKRLIASGAESLSLLGAPEKAVAAQIAFGARLAAYRFDAYRPNLKKDKRPTLESITVVFESATAAKNEYSALSARAEGVELARDLVSEPPNVLHPESYAERIRELADLGVGVEVLDEPAMKSLGMNSLLGVGQGSIRGSRLCVMVWSGAKDKSAKPLILVGKGVTFDTGGISLKPGPGMEDMKGDMGGSAAVVGAMKAIARRKAKANVVGIVGLVENMPDGAAQRPGDIVKAASGKTIEILNTDAEGRLVLADALWYAQTKFKPRAVIDLATLTGAILISLGHEHAGLFSNDDDLAAQITSAGLAEGEPVWRLPMGTAYDKQIDSDVADMKNIGNRSAGSIVAAQFLQRFVEEGVAWAHLDIAGTAWKPGNDNPLEPVWATGWGVRLLDRLVADSYED